MAPPHTAGLVYFWLILKTPHSAVDPNAVHAAGGNLASPVHRLDLCYSNAVPFYYTPADADGRLSLAYTLNSSLRNASVMGKWRHAVRELDLSYNSLDSVDFLLGFYNLTTLVLDHNTITEHVRFPSLPGLLTLSLNHNLIRDIQITRFIVNLNTSFPKLQVRISLLLFFFLPPSTA